MNREALTRRLFLQGTGTLAGSVSLRAGLPGLVAALQAACSARKESAAYVNLTNAEAREIIAIAARIMPTTDTPGATEAGVVYFFDKAFGSFLADLREPARDMLAAFQEGVASTYAGAQVFSDLDEADQDRYLKSVEDTPFFQGARFLTLAGVFGMAMHGGNRDNVGWKLVGMDTPPHAWAPPFGHYDAEYVAQHAEEQKDGE